MRIAILTTQCPFVTGGAELHAASLVRVLREAGHEAEIVSMPFKWYPSTTILDHMLAARSMDVSEFNGVKIDLAICLKFPAYLMRHPNKTYWILHQHRSAYDMWDSGHTDLFNDSNGQLVREAIREADNVEFGSGAPVFANSVNVAKRLRAYNKIVAEPLYHPPPLADRLRPGEFGDYFYYPSRISPSKRQEFVLRSMAVSTSNCRVVFSGAADNAEYGLSLARLAHDLGIADRVEWKGFVSEAEMLDLYAGARGVLFTPHDEDLGYIALEAMLAGKPVITVSDAGEPATLVRDNIEGYVVAPEAAVFADAMDRLASSVEAARTMGMAALERYNALDVSWSKVVAKLLGTRPSAAAPLDVRNAAEADDVPISHLAEQRATADENQGSPASGSNVPEDHMPELSFERFLDMYFPDQSVSEHPTGLKEKWPRYEGVLKAIHRLGGKPRRILEIGGSAPYAFPVLLKTAFPTAGVAVVEEGSGGRRSTHTIQSNQTPAEGIDIEVFELGIEKSRLPFLDGEFDLVLVVDGLEHLVVDPSFVLLEARRVLREGGMLVVTAPNLVSTQSISRAIGGISPYASGRFLPWRGARGRPAREYTPQEVEGLCRYVGLETIVLDTIAPSSEVEIPDPIRSLVTSQGLPSHLRGQEILYVGRKNVSAETDGRYPASLFTIDPRVFSGDVELERVPHTADAFIVRVLNKSPVSWPSRGTRRIRLSVDRFDAGGLIARDCMSMDLPHDIEPGRFAELPIKVVSTDGKHGSWYEIGLFAESAGAFKGTGRSQAVSLYAESLMLDAVPR